MTFPGNPHALRLREREADVVRLRAIVARLRGLNPSHADAASVARHGAYLAAKLSQLAEAERLVAETRENLARQETP